MFHFRGLRVGKLSHRASVVQLFATLQWFQEKIRQPDRDLTILVKSTRKGEFFHLFPHNSEVLLSGTDCARRKIIHWCRCLVFFLNWQRSENRWHFRSVVCATFGADCSVLSQWTPENQTGLGHFVSYSELQTLVHLKFVLCRTTDRAVKCSRTWTKRSCPPRVPTMIW